MTDLIMRQDGESDFDWKVRLITAKIEKEIDLDWVEIRDVLGLDCSPDHLRKTAYGIYEYHMNTKDSQINSLEDDLIQEFEDKRLELQKERVKLQTVKIDYNKRVREDARSELIIDEVKKSIQSVEPPKFNPLPVSNQSREAILGFGDIHFGKKFQSINNTYDELIFHKRMENLISDVIHICKKEQLDHVHVVSGGDTVEGMALRISQLTALQYGFTDQVIKYSRFIVEWLNELSKHVKITYHHINSSNHTELRLHGTKRGEMPKEDMERIIFTYIQDMLKNNERITIPEYDNDYVAFDICNYFYMAKHGHQIKNIKNAIKDHSQMYRQFIDYFGIFHVHHDEEITVNEGLTNNCKVIVYPSVMGSDEYSDSLCVGSKAGAKLDIYECNKGKVQTYDIILN